MTKKERFELIYALGTLDVTQIMADTETGVNYVFGKAANAGGMAPLLDQAGTPVVSPVIVKEAENESYT